MSKSGQGKSNYSMWTAVVAIGILYAGSTLLTPLYPDYEREFGFSELGVTEIYAIYVLGNLAVLFFFGRLSDQVGRRLTTFVALGVTMLSALCFLFATNITWLFVARVLNGFATGLGAGALTAWLAELEPNDDKSRAAVFASAGNLGGLAFGALAAGLLACYFPWPLRTTWIFFIALLCATTLTIRNAPETVRDPVQTFAKLSLRPRIGVSRELWLTFVAPAAIAFASFALAGFYAGLAPGLLAHRMGQSNVAIIGGIVAFFFGVATITAMAAQRMNNRTCLFSAVAFLWTGLGLLLLADARQAMSFLVAAALACGVAMALGYCGSLRMINEMAREDRRAELISSYLLVCYSANSLPIIGVGLLSLAVSAQTAHLVFAILLALLGLLAGVVGRTDRAK